MTHLFTTWNFISLVIEAKDKMHTEERIYVYLAWIDALANVTSVFVFRPFKRTIHLTSDGLTVVTLTRLLTIRLRFEPVVVAIATGIDESLALVASHVEEPTRLTPRTPSYLHLKSAPVFNCGGGASCSDETWHIFL